MGTVNVTQFQNIGASAGVARYIPGYRKSAQVPDANGMVSENVTSSGTSAQSTAFSAGTCIIRICSDTTVRIAFGTNPTATSAGARLVANQTEYYAVEPGQKVAVIDE